MAYNASSKNIPIVKFPQPESVKTATTSQGLNKPEKLYTADVIKSFIKDLSTLLSESNFEYKKILLDEFYTLLKNYKVVTTGDVSTISNDIIEYVKTNIITSLDNILKALENSNNTSSSSELHNLIEQGFEKLKTSNDSSDLINQFDLLNTKTNEIYDSIVNKDSNSPEIFTSIKNIEDLLNTYIKNNKISSSSNNILPTIKKYLIDSSNSIVNRLKQSNKALLSNSITKFEKITINNSKKLYTRRFVNNSKPSSILKQALDKQFYIKSTGNALEDFGNKINRGILANLYTAIKNQQKNKVLELPNTNKKSLSNKGKSSKTLTSNILNGVTKVIRGTVGKLTSKIMPFIKIGMNIFKKLAGGWLTWILVFLKNPLVITAIAFIAAFINVKIIRPIKKFWDKFIKPVFDKITEIIAPIIESIKSFVGDWLDYGIGTAFEILWETLKVRIPNLFKTVLLETKILWYKFAHEKVLKAKNWVLVNWWDPLVKWFNRYIKSPTIIAYNKLANAIDEVIQWVAVGEADRNAKNRIIEREKIIELNKSDTYDKNLNIIKNKAGIELEEVNNLINEYKKHIDNLPNGVHKPTLTEYFHETEVLDDDGYRKYSSYTYDYANALTTLDTLGYNPYSENKRLLELNGDLDNLSKKIESFEDDKTDLSSYIADSEKQLEKTIYDIREREKKRKEEEEKKKKEEEKKSITLTNTIPTLNETINNKEIVITNTLTTETTSLNQFTKTDTDNIVTAVNNTTLIVNKLDELGNKISNIPSQTSNNTIITQNQNDNTPAPSYNGGSLWQSQH